MKDDERILKLLITQFCHDIAGPIGAISNVVELSNINSDIEQNSTSISNNILEKSSMRAVSLLRIYRDIVFAEHNILYEEFIEIISDYLDLYNVNFQAKNVLVEKTVHQNIAQAIGLFCIKLCKNSQISFSNGFKLVGEFGSDIYILMIADYQNLHSLEKIALESSDYISQNCKVDINYSKDKFTFKMK